MVTVMPAAPIDGAGVLPDDLVDQYIKPDVDQVALLDAFRLTAIDWVERHTARSLERRRWVALFDGFGDDLHLPREPVHDVAALGYVDAAGTAIDGTGLLRLVGAQVLPAVGVRWPRTAPQLGAVIITFEAGYEDVAIEAPGLQIAALMLMKHLYDGGSLDDVPATVTMLLDQQYRTPVMS